MIIGERCVMCASGVGEDVEYLLMMCGEFERDRWVMADEVIRVAGGIWKSVQGGEGGIAVSERH